MMNVVCFGLSLPVEIVLPPTCNVLLTAFFLLILLQNVRPFFLLPSLPSAIFRRMRLKRVRDSISHESVTSDSVSHRFDIGMRLTHSCRNLYPWRSAEPL